MEEETTQLEHRRIDDLISDDQHEWGTEQASFIGIWKIQTRPRIKLQVWR